MDQVGLISSIIDAALAIDFGRKGFAARGKEQEGRISYETGIAEALSTFREAQSTAYPQTIILAAQNGYIEKQKQALSGAAS